MKNAYSTWKSILFVAYLFILFPFSIVCEEVESEDDFLEQHVDVEKKERDLTHVSKEVEYDLDNNDVQMFIDIEPTSIVNQCVNVITGLYQDFETDFTIPGAQPFTMQRSYVSYKTSDVSPLGSGWCWNYFGILKLWRDGVKERPDHSMTTMEALGARYKYFGKRQKCKVEKESYEYSVTNSSNGMMSGRFNIKNAVAIKHKEIDLTEINKGDGGNLKFKKCCHGNLWYLTEESLPDGNSVRYSYSSDGDIESIRMHNRKKKTLQSLRFTYCKDKAEQRTKQITVTNGSSVKATYSLLKMRAHDEDHTSYYLVGAERSDAPKVSYAYDSNQNGSPVVRIRRKSLPDKRFQKIDYYCRKDNLVGSSKVNISHSDDPRNNRVKVLKAPVGTDATPIITHRFFYEPEIKNKGDHTPPSGRADVFDALNYRTTYNWNGYKRLSSIVRYTGTSKHEVYSKEKLYWGDVDSPDCTNLLARTFVDKNGTTLFLRSFEYDEAGNVIKDELRGNLSGENQVNPQLYVSGKAVENGCENFVKTFTYSDDGFNLMLSSKQGSLKESYFYVKGTDLLAAKLYKNEGVIYKREFYSYDDSAVMIKEIIDDGCTSNKNNLEGVTQRLIKKITPQNIAPIGLPKVIEEYFVDLETNEEVLASKVVHSYDSNGKLVQQDVYDRNNNLSSTFEWLYDPMGNVILEKKPFQYDKTYTYDANGNKLSEHWLDTKYYKEFTYDFSNRLIKIIEHHDDGQKLEQYFSYDYLGNKISSIDPFGNETKYFYDEFNRLIKTVLPFEYDKKGSPNQVIIGSEYNALGFNTKMIDPQGALTESLFTIRGKPYLITYSDGSQENLIYNIDGSLKRKTAKNGSYTLYTYDHLKRPILQEIFSAEGHLLTSSGSTYSTFHLLTETDAAGLVTTFKYDCFGQLISTLKEDHLTTFEYDELGRQVVQAEHDGRGGAIIKKQRFDCLNRVVEEGTYDENDNQLSRMSYEYDLFGNKKSQTLYSEFGDATTLTEYNSRNQPVKVMDPLGNVTLMKYDYNYVNKYRQGGLKTEIMMPWAMYV